MTKYLIIVFFLFGCNTAQRQLEKTQEYLFKHPEFSAGYCAEQFPDKADSIIVFETKTDTLIDFMSLMDTTLINDTIQIKETKTKVVTKTIWRDSVIYRENRAEQERLQLSLFECQKTITAIVEKNTVLEADRNTWKGKAKTRWLWIALLIGGAVGYVGFKVFKTVKGV